MNDDKLVVVKMFLEMLFGIWYMVLLNVIFGFFDSYFGS